MFPLGYLDMHLIGQWMRGSYWPVARVCIVPVWQTLVGETYWPVATNCGFKLYLTSNPNTEQRQPRSMAEGLGACGVKECKCFSPPSVPTTNAASPRVPLGSFVSNTPTATPSRPTISSDKKGNGSCFWRQVCGEGAAHERVTRVYTTVSPSSIESTHYMDRLCCCKQKSPSPQHHLYWSSAGVSVMKTDYRVVIVA